MGYIKKLDWMTNEDYENIHWYFGCICEYDMNWKDEKDYEEWCKRVLDCPRFKEDYKD